MLSTRISKKRPEVAQRYGYVYAKGVYFNKIRPAFASLSDLATMEKAGLQVTLQDLFAMEAKLIKKAVTVNGTQAQMLKFKQAQSTESIPTAHSAEGPKKNKLN